MTIFPFFSYNYPFLYYHFYKPFSIDIRPEYTKIEKQL